MYAQSSSLGLSTPHARRAVATVVGLAFGLWYSPAVVESFLNSPSLSLSLGQSNEPTRTLRTRDHCRQHRIFAGFRRALGTCSGRPAKSWPQAACDVAGLASAPLSAACAKQTVLVRRQTAATHGGRRGRCEAGADGSEHAALRRICWVRAASPPRYRTPLMITVVRRKSRTPSLVSAAISASKIMFGPSCSSPRVCRTLPTAAASTPACSIISG